MDMFEVQQIGAKIASSFKRMQFGAKPQLSFLEDLYVLVNDGIPPNRAIDMLTQVTTGISKEVAMSIAKRIGEGQPLADGMREWFSPNIVEIIRVGEEGGALAETMRSGIKTLSQSSSTMGAFIGAIVYPGMVCVMAAAIIVYLNSSVFIQFRAIKPVEEWPEAGRTLVSVANLITSWWWAVILALVAFILIVRFIMANYTGELRPVLDKVPPFSFYRQICAARTMETLGLLVASGVVFKGAIKVMQYQANPYVSSHLAMMEHLLSKGKGNIADVLSTGLIRKEDVLRLRVMAEVKGFEHGLVRMGVHGAEETTKTLKFVGKMFGGALLGVGAYLIITIIRGIYLTGMAMGAQ
jgi:type II secretory pathway component PulF